MNSGKYRNHLIMPETMDIQWVFKPFSLLSVDELYDLLKLRVDVFVVEQNCPYAEVDEKDRHADTLHLTGRNRKDGKLAAYLRILPPGLNSQQVSMGRVVVEKNYRGRGVCDAMIKKALDQIKSIWPDADILVSAQSYLKNFYKSHGFETISQSYLEDGIPHIDMSRKMV